MADQNGTFALFKKIKHLIDSEIDDRTRSFCRTRKMTVTTAYNAGTQLVGVSEAVGKEIKIPVFGSVDVSKLKVGTAVWVFAPYSSMSNAIVFMIGDGDTGYAENASNLGGKKPEYYLQPFNLFDNSNFQINQRGQTTYEGSAQYTVDRWTIFRQATVNVIADGITITPTSTTGIVYLEQRNLLKKFKTGKIYSIAYNIDGEIVCGTFTYNGETTGSTVIDTNGDNTIRVYFFSEFIEIRVAFGTTNKTYKVEWAALYEGEYTAETLPPHVPNGYVVDLMACQQYYHVYATANARPVNGRDCAPPMRLDAVTQGTITIDDETLYYNSADL